MKTELQTSDGCTMGGAQVLHNHMILLMHATVALVSLIHRKFPFFALQCFICKIFDVLNKLLKSDKDNATGDVQLLYELFTGEKCSYHHSTKDKIRSDTPFSTG